MKSIISLSLPDETIRFINGYAKKNEYNNSRAVEELIEIASENLHYLQKMQNNQEKMMLYFEELLKKQNNRLAKLIVKDIYVSYVSRAISKTHLSNALNLTDGQLKELEERAYNLCTDYIKKQEILDGSN